MRSDDFRIEGEPIELDGGDGNDAGNDGGFVDPASVGAEFRAVPDSSGNGSGDGSPPRKRGRGRQAGSGKSGTSPSRKAQASVEGIEKILLSVHGICATFFQVPELAIDATEARLIAEASAEVARHYNIVSDPKTLAWINLSMALGAVYGPRAWVVWQRNQKPVAARPEAQTIMQDGNVVMPGWPGMAAQ